jgi:hypothetical protein
MIFPNNKTRKREDAVAKSMASMLFENVIGQQAPKEILAHYFGLACEQNNFTPDEHSTLRIIHDVTKRMNDLHQAGASLAKEVETFTDQLLRASR